MVESVVYSIKDKNAKVHLLDITYRSWHMFPKDKEDWITFFEACALAPGR